MSYHAACAVLVVLCLGALLVLLFVTSPRHDAPRITTEDEPRIFPQRPAPYDQERDR